QALTAARVGALRHDPELVVSLQTRQPDPVAVKGVGADCRGVEGDLADRRRSQVDEGGRTGTPAAETDRGHRGEGRLPAGQVNVHLIGADIEQPCPLACLVTGQIASHLLIPSVLGASRVLPGAGRPGIFPRPPVECRCPRPGYRLRYLRPGAVSQACGTR